MKDNKIPMGAIINPVKILTDEASIAKWNKEGLPADEVLCRYIAFPFPAFPLTDHSQF